LNNVRLTIIKNAISNMGRGLASAFVAILLPYFLTHLLDKDRFSAWSLILQISAYAGFFDFGIQQALSRFFAQSIEARDDSKRDQTASVALLFLLLAGLLAAITIIGVAVTSPHLCGGIPTNLQDEFRLSTCIMGIGSSAILPLSVFTGILIGLHRNEIPAIAIGLTRILGAACLVVVAHRSSSLVDFSICIVAFNLLGAILQMYYTFKLVPTLCFSFTCLTKKLFWEFGSFCLSLSTWSVGMFLVSGLDVTIVGHFTFGAVGAYALASTLINFYSGLNFSILSALLTPIAAMQVRGEMLRIRTLALKVIFVDSIGSIFVLILVLTFGVLGLRLWIGQDYVAQVYPILIILLIAQIIRLICNPFSVTIVAIGRQAHAILPVLLEGPANLICSLIGAVWFGPIGVAVGTLIGSIVGVVALVLYAIPKVYDDLSISRKEFVLKAFLVPSILFLPSLMGIYLMSTTKNIGLQMAVFLLNSICIALYLFAVRRDTGKA